MKTLTSAVFEKITPQQASAILTTANHKNRTIKPATVEQYTRAMQSGDWKISDSIIGFDESGRLVNGQHRLSALVKSGTTQHFFVARGLPASAVATFDQGRNRTASDTLRFNGLDYPRSFIEWTRAVENYRAGANTKLSVAELVRQIGERELALTFVADHTTRTIKGVTSAPVMAAVVLSYESVSDEVLSSFIQQLVSGFDANGDSNVLIARFARALLAEGGSRSSTERLALTHKTAALISAFAENNQISRMPKLAPIENRYFVKD